MSIFVFRSVFVYIILAVLSERFSELNKFVALPNFFLACVVVVNGEGEGEREKNGVLGARDEGTPATKTPFFHPRPPISGIQLS